MTAITIRETKTDGHVWTTNVRRLPSETDRDLLDRGVRKLFGRAAWLSQDSGLPIGYGQVFGRGGNAMTINVRAEIVD